jgi:DNA-binding LytR/AlgR family response regulator
VVDGAEHVLDQSLVELEERLPGFVRVHRAELVNLARVVALHRGGEGAELELDDGDRVPVSRRRLAEVEARLGSGRE